MRRRACTAQLRTVTASTSNHNHAHTHLHHTGQVAGAEVGVEGEGAYGALHGDWQSAPPSALALATRTGAHYSRVVYHTTTAQQGARTGRASTAPTHGHRHTPRAHGHTGTRAHGHTRPCHGWTHSSAEQPATQAPRVILDIAFKPHCTCGASGVTMQLPILCGVTVQQAPMFCLARADHPRPFATTHNPTVPYIHIRDGCDAGRCWCARGVGWVGPST